MIRRVTLRCKVKRLRREAEAKASAKRAILVTWRRPETGGSIHDQGEVDLIVHGGPNRLVLKNYRMSCG